MVRQIVHAESPETLQSVDHIWQELKALSEANQNAKNGITNIMKKNREECNRIASAKIQETFDMLQDELNQKDKLFGLAQERSMALIQARKNVEAGLDRKTAGLHERLSRSQMEQSLMRDEIMGAKAQLAAAQKSEKNALKMAKESVKQAEVEVSIILKSRKGWIITVIIRISQERALVLRSSLSALQLRISRPRSKSWETKPPNTRSYTKSCPRSC